MSVTFHKNLWLYMHAYLNMPMFSQGRHHPLFYWPSASSTNGNSHLIMTTQAIQLVHVIGSIAWARFHLPSIRIQLDATGRAVEMVGMVHLPTEFQRLVVDDATVDENFLIQ